MISFPAATDDCLEKYHLDISQTKTGVTGAVTGYLFGHSGLRFCQINRMMKTWSVKKKKNIGKAWEAGFDKSLSVWCLLTLPNAVEASFCQMLELDKGICLYNIIKHYADIPKLWITWNCLQDGLISLALCWTVISGLACISSTLRICHRRNGPPKLILNCQAPLPLLNVSHFSPSIHLSPIIKILAGLYSIF